MRFFSFLFVKYIKYSSLFFKSLQYEKLIYLQQDCTKNIIYFSEKKNSEGRCKSIFKARSATKHKKLKFVLNFFVWPFLEKNYMEISYFFLNFLWDFPKKIKKMKSSFLIILLVVAEVYTPQHSIKNFHRAYY